MKTNTAHQEILLLTGTNFSQREYCEKNSMDNQPNRAQGDKLEEACWNGLLPELLPEILNWLPAGKRLWLRQIRHCTSFLEIELCESEWDIEKESSIDPYLFLPFMANS